MKIIEKTQSFPVQDEYDVCVVGGGTAGAFAAIASARQGAKTVLVEQFNYPGGTQTMALVTPIMHSHIQGNPQSSGLAEETLTRLRQIGGALNDDDPFGKGWFDPQALQYVLEQMLVESGCQLLYGTMLADSVQTEQRLTHIVVVNSSGMYAIGSKVFIDCTGDGSLAAISGCAFESGDSNGSNQAVSLRFQMTQVDITAFKNYLISLGEEQNVDTPTLHTASTADNPRFALHPVFKKACDDGLLTDQDIHYFQCFSVPGKPADVAFNCPELGASPNTLDARHQTQKRIDGLSAIHRLASFLQNRIPGFENAYVSVTAPMLGIRDSRRIECEYMLTARDILNYQKFDDYIATSNYPVDIHSSGNDHLQYSENEIAEKYYHVPFRSLIVRDMHNLLVAGRCLGADFVAQSSVRVQHTCRATGEAAGIAAALMVECNLPAADVDGAAVRNIMIQKGAQFV